MVYDVIADDLRFEMEYVRENLRKLFAGETLIAVGHCGTWRGNLPAGKVSDDFDDMFDRMTRDCGYIKIWDENGHLFVECTHHDGTNRFEIKADAAQAKGEALQKPINDMHGDIAFFTQPNINTSAGRAFTRRRDRMFAAFDKGFEEFNKSDYYRERAASAQATADRKELKDRAFLNRRIEECKASLRKMRRNLTECEEAMPKAQAGTLKNWSGDSVAPEEIQNRIDHWTDRIEQELDKLGYYQDAMDALGGVQFSKENIKPGYIIQIGRYRNHDMTVLSCGPKTFTASGFDGLTLKYPYAEITKIVSAQEATPMVQPFKVGETFTVREKVYTIVKATAKTVTLQTEGEAPTRTTPKYASIPAQGKFMWRLAVGSGWCYDYFYRD